MSFFTTFNKNSPNPGTHEAVQLGKNIYVQWDYNIIEIFSFRPGQIGNVTSAVISHGVTHIS